MTDTMGATLHGVGRRILQEFVELAHTIQSKNHSQGCCKHESPLSLIDVQSETERFQLWAANIGLFAIGDRSFGYRTRDNASVNQYTRKLLNELQEDLVDVCGVVAVHSRPRTDHLLDGDNDNDNEEEEEEDEDPENQDAESSGGSEGEDSASDMIDDEETEIENQDEEKMGFEAVRSLFDDIVDIIDRLYRMAAQLRSATDRTPPSARNFYRDTCTGIDGAEVFLTKEERVQARIQSEGFHSRRIEEIIRQAQRDRIAEIEPPESELPNSTSPELGPRLGALIRRIASGNAYRQQQFIFWRQREWERRYAVSQQMLLNLQSPDAGSLLQESREQVATKNIPTHGLIIPVQRPLVPSEVPSQTWKIAKDKGILIPDECSSLAAKTERTATPTVYEPGGRKVLGWPPFPKQLVGKKEFICPYCFVTCPSSYRGKAHWRAHLIQDLQPYTCTALDCPQGDSKPLNAWDEWIVHEQLYHRMEYSCPDHAGETFSSREAYIEHVSRVHVSGKEDSLTAEAVDRQARPSERPGEPCPFCSYEADNWPDMDKHLAFHLETLALLTLPLATGLEDDAEDMDSVQIEGGGDDAVELLDNDVAGSITSLFETGEDLVDEADKQLPSGHKLTLDALSKLRGELDQSAAKDDLDDLSHPPSNEAERFPRITVGIDFGSEYTRVSYTLSRHDGDHARITTLTGWPTVDSRFEGSTKFPTQIAYEPGDTGKMTPSWGYLIKQGIPRCIWMKLLLDKDARATDHDDPALLEALEAVEKSLPSGKNVQMITADFFHELYTFIMTSLQGIDPEITLDSTPINFWLTIPAIWSDRAQMQTFKAAQIGGFGKRTIDELSLIPEPEAAALAGLYNSMLFHTDKTEINGLRILMCVCGSGTVEVTTYKIINNDPLELEECHVGEGGKFGGITLDLNLHQLLRERFGEKFDEIESYLTGPGSLMMQDFEWNKYNFGLPGQIPKQLRLAIDVEDSDHYDLANRAVILDEKDMVKIFDPLVARITKIIERQVDKGGAKYLQVVGGLGGSPYLRSRLYEMRFWNINKPNYTLISPDAVAAGAVTRGLELARVTRKKCRRHYGTVIAMPYDPTKHAGRQEDVFVDEFTGQRFIRNCMLWYIRRGSTIEQDGFEGIPFYTTLTDNEREFVVDLKSCSLDQAPERYDKKDIEPAGAIIASFRDIDLSRVPSKVIGGVVRYQVKCALQVVFGNGHGAIGFQLRFGDQVVGDTTVVFEDSHQK